MISRGTSRALGRLTPVLAVVACLAGATSSPAGAATTRACPGVAVTTPPEGYGSIIEALRVYGISCATGFSIAKKEGIGARLPRGWKCRAGKVRSICMHGRARVSWLFAGDAG